MPDTACQLRRLDDGTVALAGALTTDTIARCFEAHPQLVEDGATVTVDLSAVQMIESAGLAMLLEWQARAQANGGRIRVINASQKFRHLAAMCDADDLLAMNGDHSNVPS